MVGEDISALANSATLNDRDFAYMIWGVDDITHEIVGTKVRLQLEKKGEQELENWLRYLLSKNADFEFLETDIDGKHVELIRIHKALNEPVAFQKIDYIRSGSYTKKLHEFPVFRAQLWDKLRHSQFEDICVKTNQRFEEIIRLLQVNAYFTLLKIPQPAEKASVLHYLIEDGVIQNQDNGLFAITNLGAILFAKDLNEFGRLGRKAMRVIQYQGKNRLLIQKEETFNQGYAICFENIVRYINAILPSKLGGVGRANALTESVYTGSTLKARKMFLPFGFLQRESFPSHRLEKPSLIASFTKTCTSLVLHQL